MQLQLQLNYFDFVYLIPSSCLTPHTAQENTIQTPEHIQFLKFSQNNAFGIEFTWTRLLYH